LDCWQPPRRPSRSADRAQRVPISAPKCCRWPARQPRRSNRQRCRSVNTGGQDSFARRIYAPGDLVTINAGKNNAIEVGQEYYTRRLQIDRRAPISRDNPATVRTTGWIKVYAVDDEWSLATITHACDTIEVDDYLETFKLPVVPTVSKDRPKPERDNYGKVLVGADRRTSFGKGDYFVINRGTEHGVEVGSQFVLYRDKHQAENFLYQIGEAVATEVKADMSTVQVTVSLDAIESGDYVALRREPQQKRFLLFNPRDADAGC
jgi:hypothetical protein